MSVAESAATSALNEHWRAWADDATARRPASWEPMVEELWRVQESVAATVPTDEAAAEVGRLLGAARHLLEAYWVAEPEQVYGRLLHLPRRGQTLSPAMHVTVRAEDELVATTAFGRSHLGHNGAVHGGAVAMLFDDALGRAADLGDRPRSRTASLTVDYRAVTPAETTLTVRAVLERQDGRKRYLRGTLHDGDRLCAEASALFVEMRADQQ